MLDITSLMSAKERGLTLHAQYVLNRWAIRYLDNSQVQLNFILNQQIKKELFQSFVGITFIGNALADGPRKPVLYVDITNNLQNYPSVRAVTFLTDCGSALYVAKNYVAGSSAILLLLNPIFICTTNNKGTLSPCRLKQSLYMTSILEILFIECIMMIRVDLRARRRRKIKKI